MEVGGLQQEGDEESQLLPSRSPSSVPTHRRSSPSDPWPTIDGPLGLSIDESLWYAQRFFWWGWCLLPLLWAVNCLYFWPVLRSVRPFSSGTLSQTPHPFDGIRKYVVRSAIGFTFVFIILFSWALTFAIGGEKLFGVHWKDFVMYNIAEKYGITDWNSF